MNSLFTVGRNFLFFIVFACIALFETSCGVFDKASSTSSQERAGLVTAGEQAGSGLAVAGFQFVATQALEQQCDEGQSSACKIVFALDPNYKIVKTQEEINAVLKSMDSKLDDINAKLNDIVTLLDNLAAQLNIAVADLKMDSGNVSAKPYLLNIVNAYEFFETLDYTDDKNTVNTPLAVSSIMTNDHSDTPFGVPQSLLMLHGLIVDDATGTGLLQKMDDLIKSKIDDIWNTKHRPPTDEEANNFYELMEQYFGYLLMQQAKGLVVVSASYKYLDKFPDARISPQSITIKEELNIPNFEAYQDVYNKRINDQIKTFLKHVENYIAYTADVEKPGADIKGWTSVVLKRADLTAAWARESLKTKVVGTASSTPILLAVRVLGEPDRSKLFYSYSSAIRDNLTQKRFAIDKDFINSEDFRVLTTRQPYMQFPVHLDKTKGTVERDGAIKGANSFIMNKYILTGSDGISTTDGEIRPITVESWIGDVGGMKMELVGPDGNAPKAGGPAMYFGHTTIVLKETAARLGIWSHGIPSEVYANTTNVDNLKHSAHAQDSFPQSAQLSLSADPKRSSKNEGDPSGGAEWTEYYLNGHAYYYEGLEGNYYFEGWGDVPEKDTWRVGPILSGTSTHDVQLPASNGSQSMELYFAMESGQEWVTASTAKGDVNMSVVSAHKWAPNTSIRLFIEPRIKCDWNTFRSTSDYGTSTFKGTNTFKLKSLVLKVNE